MFAVEKTIWACSYCRHVLRLNVIPSTRTDNIHLRWVMQFWKQLRIAIVHSHVCWCSGRLKRLMISKFLAEEPGQRQRLLKQEGILVEYQLSACRQTYGLHSEQIWIRFKGSHYDDVQVDQVGTCPGWGFCVVTRNPVPLPNRQTRPKTLPSRSFIRGRE